METYGKALFVLVLMAILIVFAHPLGVKIKEYTLAQAEHTNSIGDNVINDAYNIESMNNLYAVLCSDGELQISGNPIEVIDGKTKDGKTVSNNYGEVNLKNISGSTVFPWINLSFIGNKNVLTVKILDKIKPITCYRMFYGLKNLTEIKNIENLDTSECTDMNGMFFTCETLNLTDLSTFNTSKVTDMYNMFGGISSWYDPFVTNDFIKTLKNWDVSNVMNFSQMFQNCKNLTDVSDLLQWNINGNGIHKDANMQNMFKDTGCTNPFTKNPDNEIYVQLLKTGTLEINLQKVNHGSDVIFEDTISLTESMTTSPLKEIEISTGVSIKKININDVIKPISCKCLFQNLDNLESFEFGSGLIRFDTSDVTDMSYMFDGCTNLKTLDLSNFDTRNVERMDKMFRNCRNLNTVTFGHQFKTNKVTTMDHMFSWCRALTDLDLSTFDSSNLTSTMNMFHTCVSLKTLTFGENFNCSKVTSLSDMFAWCNAHPTVNSSEITKIKLYTDATKAKTYIGTWNVQ